MAEFKDRIKSLRKEKGLTATQLAFELGRSESSVRVWEMGRSKPDIDTLIRLAEMFKCPTDYLLGLSDARASTDIELMKAELFSIEHELEAAKANRSSQEREIARIQQEIEDQSEVFGDLGERRWQLMQMLGIDDDAETEE
ncbi:helix-turn-helix domain-containing protein [Eubacteriales bacterium OttesenSCG-928-M02]|nr:helix-turn-helix domain-containing protein [Eubacteriales bacterium OttesenSCG-928-M02]